MKIRIAVLYSNEKAVRLTQMRASLCIWIRLFSTNLLRCSLRFSIGSTLFSKC
jgi:hypothetical protein